MKVGIIGGGISGLSTAYYLKKFRFPASQISIFEASNRLGGWISSKRIDHENDTIFFEGGPRTLRLSTGELKEINSIQLAQELNLGSSIDIIPKTHPASQNRFIYFNNKINPIQPKLFGKTDLMGKSILGHIYKEFVTPPRDKTVQDESIWSFISRRADSTVADNLVDPVFKGICGGDIKYLSAATFLENFYKYELEYGSISKGVFKKKPAKAPNPLYSDLVEMKKSYMGQSVWRLRNGLEEMVVKLHECLSRDEDVKIHLNEPLTHLEINDTVKLKTKSVEDDFDIVISCASSNNTSKFLPDKYKKLKDLLEKIPTVDMVVINLYFKKDILPAKGFGYLVPTNQNSPILGCIFDSVFNQPTQNNTVLTVMMGGAWFDQYIGGKTNDQIYSVALEEIKKQLNIQIDPDLYQVNILKDSIPQYRVGHLKLLDEIDEYLKESNIDKKLYLTGWSYKGIGVNDCIFNARKLVQEKLLKNDH